VVKWRQRRTPDDRKTGPKEPHSTTLTIEEEAIIVAFRRHTLLRWMIAFSPCELPSRI
jgi:hypothetical protein